MTNYTQRNNKIDWLRTIGTLLILLAHASPPEIIKNIRCFDVSLLLLLSGMSYELSRKKASFGTYVLERTKKLLLPMYIVMTLIFIGTYALSFLARTEPMYSLRDYLYTLLLTNEGIGYVWIVKVYLVSSLCAPYLSKEITKFNNITFSLIYVIALVFYRVCYQFYSVFIYDLSDTLGRIFIEEYILGCFAYLIVVAIGIKLIKQPSSWKWIMTISLLGFAVTQIIISIGGGTFEPNVYKFPPTAYYIFYSLFMSLIIYMVVPNKKIQIIEWVSKHSYDIYVLHIPVIIILMIMRSNSMSFLPAFVGDWRFKYVFLIFGSFSATIIYEQVHKRLSTKMMG